ncbi:MAG: cation transporter [Bdellovibrionales bacterium]|nr:cation transporter [Bdellovibrionales bacterium]
MGKSCCETKASELASLRQSQSGVLKTVLLINAGMFLLELVFGFVSKSTALTADSLDMLGDAAVYGFSLYALHRGALWRARAGLVKGILMALFAVGVLGHALYRFLDESTPQASTMGFVAVVALAANAICLYLLYSHRQDDINMRSTWLCSRNDIVANVGVIVASWLVFLFQSGLPDLVVGCGLAGLFLWSGVSVIREARNELLTIRLK